MRLLRDDQNRLYGQVIPDREQTGAALLITA
jgi:hypothetical protein